MTLALLEPISDAALYGPFSAGMRMSPEEFDDLPEAAFDPDYRYQLIDGVLIVTPPAGLGKRLGNEYLGGLLFLYQVQHPQGRLLLRSVQEQTVAVGPNRRRVDRALWIAPNSVDEIPTIVVDFVSDCPPYRGRDYAHKRMEYADARIKEYWIVDRFRRTMAVFRGIDSNPVVLPEGATYRPELLPGFELPIDHNLLVDE